MGVYTQFPFGYAYHACPHCDWSRRLRMWIPVPYPGHNLWTLYECTDCGAVVSLAEMADAREVAFDLRGG